MVYDLKWLAGFFDGEGSIGVYTNGKHTLYLKVQLSQTYCIFSQSLFEWLVETYGGNFIKLSTSSGRDKLHWQISSDKASSFLGDILPYLVYKHDQAWIAIAYQFSKDMSVSRDRDTGRILPKATNPLDRKVYMLLRELKKKDIDQVMADQDDLVEVVAVLHQILNYKGT